MGEIVPTSQRMRQRNITLTEQQDLDLGEMARVLKRPASDIVRAAVARSLAEWRAKRSAR